MRHELVTLADAQSLAAKAAEYVATLARSTVVERGVFTFAVSGGTTPWAMFAELAHHDVPWPEVLIFQVDERVAPEGDPDRNLTHLTASLEHAPGQVTAMPVSDSDLDAGAAAYAAQLPEHFDLVHLGLGPDGHTASLTPGDPVLDVQDRLVAVTQPYQGHRRMTLTYPALNRARRVLWVVTGPDKTPMFHRLLDGDVSIPAGRVRREHALVIADQGAAGDRAPQAKS